ncbi:hypothetical protein ACTFIY_006940 [Dictyostelium cf. discoideum]
MSVFRDLVEGECSEPNALGNFVQHFTNERSYHDKFEDHGKNEFYDSLYRHEEEYNEQRHLDSIFDGEGQEDDIHLMMDRHLNLRDGPREHKELPLSNVESDLQFLFQDFINSTRAGQLFHPSSLNHLPLTFEDKSKIKNRSSIMLKHFSNGESEQFEEDQLNRMLDSLGIEVGDDFDQVWDSQPHHTTTTTTTTTTTATTGQYDQYQKYVNDLPEEYEDYEQHQQELFDGGDLEDYELDEEWDKGDDFHPYDSAWTESDRSVEAAWDETARRTISDITRPITQINDPKLKKSNFMKFMNQLNSGEASIVGSDVVHNPDFKRQEEYQQQADQWTEDYNDFHEHIPQHRIQEYQFSIQEARDSDTLERGMGLFNEGHLSDSIIALESEVKRNPENAMAWMYLGIAHAENDQDSQATTCLIKSLQIDPTNSKARLALAVSHTNDYQKERALDTLEEWLQRTPEYTALYKQFKGSVDPNSFLDTWSRHEFTTNLFIEAARSRPSNPDPEVQTALGLLYNMSYDYDKAVDCFKAALQNSPTDYQLWNKLGATLANSNRSQEALGAYFKALEHKPSYVRARSNLGISYLSLNMFQESATTFLGAIAIHPAPNIWDNLKMVFRLMNREDLVQKADLRDVNAFLDEFQFM